MDDIPNDDLAGVARGWSAELASDTAMKAAAIQRVTQRAVIEIDDATGLALSIVPIRIGGVLEQAEPPPMR